MQWRPMLYAGLVAAATGFSLPGTAAAQAEGSSAAAAEQNPLTGDAEAIAAGKKLYAQWACYGCHGMEGGGGMGPSLIDTSWLYGGSDAEVFKSIHDGRPRGMPPWGSQLSREEIHQMMAYIRSLYEGDEAAIAW